MMEEEGEEEGVVVVMVVGGRMEVNGPRWRQQEEWGLVMRRRIMETVGHTRNRVLM